MNIAVRERVCECENPDIEDPFSYDLDQITGSLSIKTCEPYTFTLRFGDGTEVNNRCLHKMLGFTHYEQNNFIDSWENDSKFNLCLDELLLIKANNSTELNTVYDCNTKDYYFNIINLRPWKLIGTTISSDGSGSLIKPTVYDRHLYLESVIDNSDLDFNYLDFSFYNEQGQPINLDRLDIKLVIQIIEYSDRLVGQNINTRRGIVDYTSITDKRVETLRTGLNN